MFNLLRDKNFLVLFLGRIITNIGDSLYYVASMWLVHELGENPFYTGLAGFLILLPKALQFLTGPLVDKWKVKKTLVRTQLIQSILILIIPTAHIFNLLSVQLILIVMPLIAIVEEFAYPTQTKALPLILQKSNLVKGNALFAFAYQGVDLVFNAVAGIIVAAIGAISIYLIDSVTFAAAAVCFALVKVAENHPVQSKKKESLSKSARNYIIDLSEGITLVFTSLLWVFLIGSVVANFAIGSTMAVLPIYSDQLGGANIYGILLTALSAGSLIGALLGSIVGKFKVGIIAIVCFALGAVSWCMAAWISSPIPTAILFGFAWIPIGAINVLFAGVNQAIIPNRLLGRVNSVMYSMSIVAMPIGSLLGGYAATLVDSQFIFAFSGIGVLFLAVIWALHPGLRNLPKAEEMNAETFRLKLQTSMADSVENR